MFSAYKHIKCAGTLIETGYNYLQGTSGNNAHLFPQSEVRIGVTNNTEIDIFPYQYIYAFPERASGFTPFSIGLKHIAFYDEHQLFTLQGLCYPIFRRPVLWHTKNRSWFCSAFRLGECPNYLF